MNYSILYIRSNKLLLLHTREYIMSIHKYNSDSYARLGEQSEIKFINIINSKFTDRTAHKSTIHENIYKHVDVYITYKGKQFSVDVKARKSDRLFIELQQGGRAGWLYANIDYFAFHVTDKDQMILVKAKDLRELVMTSNKRTFKREQYDEKLTSITYNELLKIAKAIL